MRSPFHRVLGVFSWTVLILITLPTLIIIPISFSSVSYYVLPPPGLTLRWYENFFLSPEWLGALVRSGYIGISTTIISMVLGTLAAMALSRGSFRGKIIVQAILLSPLIVPAIIVAIGLYFWLVRLNMGGSALAIILGHTVVATPFVIAILTPALEGLDPGLGRAARSLGASPIMAFRRITLPLLLPAFASAAFVAFLQSLDELIIATFLTGPGEWTLPIQMVRGIRFETNPTIAAVSVLLMSISVLAIVLPAMLRRRAAGLSTRDALS
jgi:putative spermidine/putrescine transport system permease protein